MVLATMGACGNESDRQYEPAGHAVSFETVQALPYRAPDHEVPYGDEALQYGALWLPEKSGPGSAPLVVMLHGGCWLNAYAVDHVRAFSTALSDAGYAVWSLEYRRTGDAGGGWPGSLEDVHAALATLSALEQYGVEPHRPVISGHSAGGHLALLAGGSHPEIRAVIGLAAITDIIRYARGDNSCQQAAEPFMGGPFVNNENLYQAANPVQQARHDRTILLHGTADALVPPGQANMESADTVLIEDAGHFDWVHPGTPAFQLLLETLAEVFAE